MIKYIEEIIESGAWKGKRCFLIGGGPSLKGFDPNLLDNELTIGTNKAFIKFDTTVNYSMDLGFHDKLVTPSPDDREGVKAKEMWENYRGVKIFLKIVPKFAFGEGVVLVRKIEERTISFDLNKGIFPGSNTGFGALMLAVAFGANPIYLLGYDFKVDESIQNSQDGSIRNTHWHGGYFRQNSEGFKRKLIRFRKEFEDFVDPLKDLGVEVINLNPNSDLKDFPFNTIDRILDK